MSLQAFQRAVVELTLAPLKARALRAGDSGVLAAYDLTTCEQDRLQDIVRQRGISVHCSLSRGNRYEIIHNAFPMTCVLLKPKLRELLSELFEDHRPTNYQLAGEETAFAAMLEAKIAAGELAIEYLQEVFAYEVKCLELTRQVWSGNDPHAEVEFAMEFQHPPDELLPPLSRLTAPPAGLPQGSYRVWVRLRAGRFRVEAA
jgi:hypothetical protein